MNARIRFAGPGDAEIIHRFICDLAEYEREPDAVEVTPQILRDQMAGARPPFECLLLEEEGGEVAGFALFFQTYSTWRGRPGIHLEDLFVPPRFRGRGYGKALLARVTAVAHERGFARVEWAVLDWNQPAIDFYEGLGAKRMGEWFTYRLDGDALASLAGEGA